MFGLRKDSSANDAGSKGNFEICMLGIERKFLNFGFSYVACKRVIYVGKAMGDLIRVALSEHLNRAVRHVANEAS